MPSEETIHNSKVSKGRSAFSSKASAFSDWPPPYNPLRARLLANNKDGLTADAAIKNLTVDRGALVTAERTPRAGPTTNWAVFSSVPTDFLLLLLRAVLTLISSDPPCFALCARLKGRPGWLWGGDADRHRLWHFITVFASPRCACLLTSYRTLARSSIGIDH